MNHALSRRIRPDAPTLWERAKAMFASVRNAFSLARDFSLGRLCQRERRRLSAGLKPVERIVRTLMIMEAFTFLLMTEEGRRLCAEARRIEPPAPPVLRGCVAPQQIILIPGWHTIAALRPVIDPRVVDREHREALARNAAAAEQLSQLMDSIADPNGELDGSEFRVLRWVHDRRPGSDPDATTDCDSDDDIAPPLPPRPRIMLDPLYPVLPSMLPDARKALAPPRPPHDDTGPDRDLARRFAALIRVLANPEPAIRRLAKKLAALPIDCLPLLGPGYRLGRRPGDAELLAAIKLGHRATSAYTRADRALTRPPEPG